MFLMLFQHFVPDQTFMKCLTIMRKCALLNIHKILQSEQYIKSKDIQQDKHSE